MSEIEAELLYRQDGPIAWVTFNRPQARNAMTWAMYDGLRAACDRVAYEARIERDITHLESLPKPTVALIRGYAVGAGASLALACDLRLATSSAQFGIP